MDNGLIDQDMLRAARSELGSAFLRILGYFREDGTKSVAAIEDAMRAGQAAALVIPAHTLKSEARQFGAMALSAKAEQIEHFARHCVECRHGPDEYVKVVVELRPLFEQSLAILERESNPLKTRARPDSLAPLQSPMGLFSY